ncbi:MAG TPA: hypothetical protein VJY62_16940 [Bacteroidia bacterium]|nr:hypothetical protein [Bacteroidia bacterium]
MMTLKLSHTKNLLLFRSSWFIILIQIILSAPADAASLYSRNNGNWTAASTWSYTSGGGSCGCTPGSSDIVYINHNVSLNKDLTNSSAIAGVLTIYSSASLVNSGSRDFEVKSGGNLDLRGTLTVYNVTFDNGSAVNVSSTGNITIDGTFHNKNNSNNVVINGTVTVLGPFINGNGSVISGTGTVTVTNGPATNDGYVFGCTTTPFTFPASFPCGGVPLPVELTGFKVSLSKNKEALLSWITATETNNAFFTIEKSTDAKVFKVISDIPGAGSTSAVTDYNYIDPVTEKGPLYYRLSQTDFNGKNQVLQTISVPVKDDDCIQIQTPAINNGDVVVHLNCRDYNSAAVTINDLYGNCLGQQVITANDNLNNLNNVFKRLGSGMYIVTVVANNKVTKAQLWKF